MSDGGSGDASKPGEAIAGELVPAGERQHHNAGKAWGNGAKPFEPTDRDREVVEQLAALGYTQPQMCLFVLNPSTGKPIAEDTLREHFSTEIEIGLLKANAIIGGTLFRKAKSGDNAAMFFWLKTRAGWSEKPKIEEPEKGDDGEVMPAELVERARAKLQRFVAGKEAAATATAQAPPPEPEPVPAQGEQTS